MRYVYIALGITFIILGVIGIMLPLLPTTPFLLLASALFIKSSEKLYSWLLNQRMLGPYLKNFMEKRAIPLRAKITSIALMWAAIIYSIILTAYTALHIILIITASGVTAYILSFRTLNNGNQNQKG